MQIKAQQIACVIAAGSAITILICLANYSFFTDFTEPNLFNNRTLRNTYGTDSEVQPWARPQWMISPANLVKFAEHATKRGTDKFTVHSYEGIYWLAFSDLYQQNKSFLETARIWEIGLGCGMQFGVGGSAFLWRTMFPKGKIHFFEYDKACAEAWTLENPTTAVVHIGDQSKPEELLRAINNTGEKEFDIMIDDGGHHPPFTKISLVTLWPFVKPGGVYVIEDIHVNCIWENAESCFKNSNGATFFSELVTDWLQTIVRDRNANPPQLPNLERIEFHHEAVVFTKKQNIQI